MSAWSLAAFAVGFTAIGFAAGWAWFRVTLATRMARIGADEMADLAADAIAKLERSSERRRRRLMGKRAGRHLVGSPPATGPDSEGLEPAKAREQGRVGP